MTPVLRVLAWWLRRRGYADSANYLVKAANAL